MSLRLVIEHSPYPQQVADRTFEAGDLSIGRGAECDWQLDDPDSFMSRKHCVVSGRDGHFTVTDASRGGLFVDGQNTPLGAGVAAKLENGTRLRLGDVVIRAEMPAAANDGRPVPVAVQPQGLRSDDFFAPRQPDVPRAPRPDSLPAPFEGGPAPFAATPPARFVAPPVFDDPFTLDPVATPGPAASPSTFGDFSFSFGDPDLSASDPAPTWFAPGPATTPAIPETAPTVAIRPPVNPHPAPPSAPAPLDTRTADPDLAVAFFQGLGLDPATVPAMGTPAEFQALGLRYRLLVEGLITLLRTRAREKNSIRVAQTILGAAAVNPLKFLATSDDAVAALVAPRGKKGYLAPEDAITAAYRDLSDHQMRSWTALQSSLRRMIDRFDPAALEAEVEEVGVVKSLLTGNRSARLWQLYTERYRDIAKSAEDRFLGDVGADFRNAYEGDREDQT